MEPNYQLLTTIRYDPFLLSLPWNTDQDGPSPFLLLPYHLDRLCSASEEHGWLTALNYRSLKSAVSEAISQHGDNACRIRVLLSRTGHLSLTVSQLQFMLQNDPAAVSLVRPDDNMLPDSLLNVRLDKQATPISLFTSTKTTQRRVYDDARERNAIPPMGTPAASDIDVLLYNNDQLVTETTIFNVAFFRSSSWVTPSTSTGCLPGIMRKWLLEHGRISEDKEGMLTKSEIRPGEMVLLFNGLQGCRLGTII